MNVPSDGRDVEPDFRTSSHRKGEGRIFIAGQVARAQTDPTPFRVSTARASLEEKRQGC